MSALEMCADGARALWKDDFRCLMQTGRFIRRQGMAACTAHPWAWIAQCEVKRVNLYFCHLNIHQVA